MPMHFEELDETTRRFMLAEFEAEETSGKPYRARGLSSLGLSVFHDLMREAIQSGTDHFVDSANFGDSTKVGQPQSS